MNYLLLSVDSAVIDIVALLFIALFALFGFLKGFTKTFISVFGTIASIIIAVLLAPALAELLQNSFSVVNTLTGSVAEALGNLFGEQVMNMPLSQATEQSLSQTGLAGFIIKIVLQVKDQGAIPLDTTLNQIICPTFAYYIVLIISAVAVFILTKIVFLIIRKLVKLAYACEIVRNVDRLLGLFLGIINGIFNLELIILAISIIPLAFFQDIYAGIQLSIFANFIEDINLYAMLLDVISGPNVIGAIENII